MWEKGVRESTGEMGRKEKITKIRPGIKGGGVGDMGRRVERCTKRNLKWVKTRGTQKVEKREGTKGERQRMTEARCVKRPDNYGDKQVDV